MRIIPINNINSQIFGANLQKKDAVTLYGVVETMKDGIPKLYTVLELFNSMKPGVIAELKYLKGVNIDVHKPIGFRTAANEDNCWQLRVNGKLLEQGSNVYNMLCSAVMSETNMTKDEFTLMCEQNSSKTKNDVEALLV